MCELRDENKQLPVASPEKVTSGKMRSSSGENLVLPLMHKANRQGKPGAALTLLAAQIPRQ
jgi:hypothetical protein